MTIDEILSNMPTTVPLDRPIQDDDCTFTFIVKGNVVATSEGNYEVKFTPSDDLMVTLALGINPVRYDQLDKEKQQIVSKGIRTYIMENFIKIFD